MLQGQIGLHVYGKRGNNGTNYWEVKKRHQREKIWKDNYSYKVKLSSHSGVSTPVKDNQNQWTLTVGVPKSKMSRRL